MHRPRNIHGHTLTHLKHTHHPPPHPHPHLDHVIHECGRAGRPHGQLHPLLDVSSRRREAGCAHRGRGPAHAQQVEPAQSGRQKQVSLSRAADACDRQMLCTAEGAAGRGFVQLKAWQAEAVQGFRRGRQRLHLRCTFNLCRVASAAASCPGALAGLQAKAPAEFAHAKFAQASGGCLEGLRQGALHRGGSKGGMAPGVTKRWRCIGPAAPGSELSPQNAWFDRQVGAHGSTPIFLSPHESWPRTREARG